MLIPVREISPIFPTLAVKHCLFFCLRIQTEMPTFRGLEHIGRQLTQIDLWGKACEVFRGSTAATLVTRIFSGKICWAVCRAGNCVPQTRPQCGCSW